MDVLKSLLDLNILNIIDIVLVAILLYYIYKLLKGTVAINIFIGIVILYFFSFLVKNLEMRMLSIILGGFMSTGIIALIVLFQPEVRKFLLMLGSTNFAKKNKAFKRLQFLNGSPKKSTTDAVSIVKASNSMSSSKTGALIIIERNTNLDFLVDTGDKMNINLTQAIIETIFLKNSPLHDGAIIISDNVIKATRVILPVSNQREIPSHFGLRHRAAIGISENTDALAIVVSEETGQVSYIKNGEFIIFEDSKELTNKLESDLV